MIYVCLESRKEALFIVLQGVCWRANPSFGVRAVETVLSLFEGGLLEIWVEQIIPYRLDMGMVLGLKDLVCAPSPYNMNSLLAKILLVFGVPYIHWRRILIQMEVLQSSQIKHRHVHALCMIISRLIGLIS